MAEENNLIEEAVIDTKNKDIADLTAQVKKWQTNIENAIIEEKETSLQLKQMKKRLNEEEQQNAIQSQPAVSKAIVNIDGVEFGNVPWKFGEKGYWFGEKATNKFGEKKKKFREDEVDYLLM